VLILQKHFDFLDPILFRMSMPFLPHTMGLVFDVVKKNQEFIGQNFVQHCKNLKLFYTTVDYTRPIPEIEV